MLKPIGVSGPGFGCTFPDINSNKAIKHFNLSDFLYDSLLLRPKLESWITQEIVVKLSHNVMILDRQTKSTVSEGKIGAEGMMPH